MGRVQATGNDDSTYVRALHDLDAALHDRGSSKSDTKPDARVRITVNVRTIAPIPPARAAPPRAFTSRREQGPG